MTLGREINNLNGIGRIYLYNKGSLSNKNQKVDDVENRLSEKDRLNLELS